MVTGGGFASKSTKLLARMTRFFSLFLCVLITACSPRTVVLVPGPDDLVTINGCVVTAVSYMAAVRSQQELRSNFWSRVLLVRFENYSGGHAYCVWMTDGQTYAYDRTGGSFPLPVATQDARTIALILAQGMRPHLGEKAPVVSSASFINPKSAVIKEHLLAKS